MKRNRKGRLLAAALALSASLPALMPMTSSWPVIEVHAQGEENLALHKEVSVSGYEGGRKEDGSLTYPQFEASNITDGNPNTRWSAATEEKEQWCIVDLGSIMEINTVILQFQECPHYQVLVSEDGSDWQLVADKTANQIDTVTRTIQFETRNARYVKLLQLEQRLSGGVYYGIGVAEIEVYKQDIQEPNLAFEKAVEVSGYEGGFNDDGSMKYPQFAAGNVTDGNHATRWSASEFEDEQWCTIDLGSVMEINEIDLDIMECPHYQILVSEDGVNYTVVKEYTNMGTGTVSRKVKFKNRPARYVKLLQLERRNTNVGIYGISVSEIEVYCRSELNLDIEDIEEQAPVVSEDGEHLVLPVLEGYDVSLYAVSNEAVVSLDGTITSPLEEMEVSVMYQAISKKDPSKVLTASNEVFVTIPAKTPKEETDNAKPDVLPALREWKGSQGTFALSDSSRIVLPADADETVQTMMDYGRQYLKETTGLDLPVVSGEAAAGDLVFSIDPAIRAGKEGYAISITDQVDVTAADAQGLLYAAATLSQIFQQSTHHNQLPKGEIMDYPEYEVRSCFFDVARFYMPLDYLKDLTRYMAYFKLNQIHVHINDDGGEQNTAFRLESKKYPEINSSLNPDEIYSQEDYRAYQKEAASYGMQVITEIDSPSHASFAALHDPSLMLDFSSIDIRNPQAVQFIEDVIDEFITGDDPVIQGNILHIGCDEYQRYTPLFDEYRADAAKYYKEITDHVRTRGYEPRMWNMLGSTVYPGVGLVDTSTVMNYFYSPQADYQETIDAGYPCINSDASWLYIVPEVGYANNIPLETLYSSWNVNDLGGGFRLPKASPQMLGAEPCFWYDVKVGCSQFDIFNVFKKELVLSAEKTWYGSQTKDQTTEGFMDRVNTLSKTSPLANPARYVESEDTLVASYDFEESDRTTARDRTENRYDAKLSDLTKVYEQGNQALKLNGSGSMNLPFDSLGFPYSVSFDLWIDEAAENAVLFESPDGKIVLNWNGTGQLALLQKDYVYTFNKVLETGKWMNLNLIASGKGFTLIIDGEETLQGYSADGANYVYAGFVLPVQKIGSGVKGKLDNLQISSEAARLSDSDTSSKVNGEVLPQSRAFTNGASLSILNDGIYGVSNLHGDASYGSLQNAACDGAEFIIDLGKKTELSRVGISALNHPAHAVYLPRTEFFTADNPEGPWTSIGTLESLDYPGLYSDYAGSEIPDEVLKEQQGYARTINTSASGRYVKAVINRFDPNAEWIFLDEILIYAKADLTLLNMAISQAETLIDAGALEGVNPLVQMELQGALDQAKAIQANRQASQKQANSAWIRLAKAIHMLGFKTDFTELDLLLAQAASIDTTALDPALAAALEEAIAFAQAVRNDPAALTDISIAEAVEKLQAVLAQIPDQEIDTALLQLLVSSVENEDLNRYIEAGKAEFQSALESAKAQLAHPQSQSEVDAAALRLHEAWLNLRLKADESLLQALQGFLNEASQLDLSRLTVQETQQILQLQETITADLADTANLSQKKAKADLEQIAQVQHLLNKAKTTDNQTAGASSASSVKTAAGMQPSGWIAAGPAALSAMLMGKRRKNKK